MESRELIDMTKEYLSDTRNTIKLYDLVINQTIVISHLMFEETLAGGTERSIEELTRRLKEYEHIVDDLLHVSSLVAFWGKPDHALVIRRALTSLTDRLDAKSGLNGWSDLRWWHAPTKDTTSYVRVKDSLASGTGGR